MQEEYGIENDSFVLSDNFENYGFESSGMIRNLQIMFIGILFLMFFPLIALLIKAIFYCCDNPVSRFFNRVIRRVFWNSYIRFWMEAYLELCISSMLRLKIFSLDSPSDSFHSCFSVFICVVLAAFFIASITILVVRFDKLGFPES